MRSWVTMLHGCTAGRDKIFSRLCKYKCSERFSQVEQSSCGQAIFSEMVFHWKMLSHWSGNVLPELVRFSGVLETKVLQSLQIETKYYVSTFLFRFILPFSSHLISFQFFYYFNTSWHLEHVDITEMFYSDVCKLNCFKILLPHSNGRWKQASKYQSSVWVGNSGF